MSLLAPTRRFLERGTAPAATIALVFATIAGCSSGSSGGGGGALSLNSLSGTVQGSGGAGLAGVTVTVNCAMATTDANGSFIIPSVSSLPNRTVEIEIDGSGAGGPGQFPVLDVIVDIPPGTPDFVLPQVITLPDLNNPASATQTVALAADGSTTAPIAVSGAQADIRLDAPTGTIVTIGGVVGAAMVDLNVTPVPPVEVPMPLPAGLLGSAFVTVQPGNAAFDPPGAALGLDVALPNDLNFPAGSQVEIWSFDHDAGDWVNRSQETGEMGTVVDLGGGMSEIQASGVITEGGWHAGVFPVDAACATTVVGRVVDQATGDGIASASIRLSTGNFASTDSNGDFMLPLIAAYDVNALATSKLCSPLGFSYQIFLPPAFGADTGGEIAVDAMDVVAGGMTQIGDSPFALGTSGSVAGFINGTGASPKEPVIFNATLGSTIMVVPNPDGSFFVSGLEAGPWTASYNFAGAKAPSVQAFDVVANQITSINIQVVTGGGGDSVSVLVLFDDDDSTSTPMLPCVGAQVTLQGTDSGSASGLAMTVGASGTVTFNDVTGPFNVTAQKDLVIDLGPPFGVAVFRHAQSLIGVSPADGTIGLIIAPDEFPGNPAGDATLSGTVSNLPTLAGAQSVQLLALVSVPGLGTATSQTTVNPGDGSYSLPVPSGLEIHCALYHEDPTAPGAMILSLLLEPSIGVAPGGGTLNQDFDFASPSLVPFDQNVDVTFGGGVVPADDVFLCVSLEDGANGVDFELELFTGSPGALPINLPNVQSAGLSGYDFFVTAIQEQTIFSECDKRLTTTPASLAFDFLVPPTPIMPPRTGVSLSASQLANLTLTSTDNGSGSFGLNGAQFLFLLGDADGSQGFDVLFWELVAPAGTESVPVPPVALPVFDSLLQLSVAFNTFRLSGASVDFNSTFNANVEANVAQIENSYTDICEGSDFGFVFITGP